MSRFFSSKYDTLIPYVPGEQPQKRQYIKLNTNESPFPPSPLAQSLARQAAGDLQLYSDPECHALRQAASAHWGVGEDQLLFTNGSDEILNFAFMAFCDSTHPAAFADITYGFYPVFAAINGIPYTEIALNADFTVNISDYIGIGKTVFIANPNAPTGIALPLRDIEKIVASNPDNVVVVDEAYVDFGAQSAVSLIDKYENLLVTQTFSKSRSLAGGRLGVGIANARLICDLNTIKYSTNPYNVNRVTQAAGIGALTDDAYFRQNCELIRTVRDKTAQTLREMGFTVTPSQTNFLFAAHGAIDGLSLYTALKENGILVRHFHTDRLKDYNRITVGSAEQMAVLCETIAQILEKRP